MNPDFSEITQLSRDLGNVVFTTEGSGEEAKYFIQIGADTASKKELGNIVSASEIHASIGDISQGQTSFGKFSGFKTLNYSISSQASDRYIYLYVNETRIDTVAGTTKSGSYILEPDEKYFITLRSSWGMGSGLISLS